jgi:hypothetical protein
VAKRLDTAPLSLTLGVRPARALVLVPQIFDIPWERTFEAAIAAQMRSWGGGAHLVMPYSDDLGDHPLFWQLADRLDPDQVRIYTGSVAELEYLDPARYAEAEATTRAQMEEMAPETQRTWWEEWRELQLVEYAIPAELRETATRRLALLQLPGWEEWMWTNGTSDVLEPFSDVTLFRDLPPVVTDVDRTNIGDLERLLLTVEVRPPGAGYARRIRTARCRDRDGGARRRRAGAVDDLPAPAVGRRLPIGRQRARS